MHMNILLGHTNFCFYFWTLTMCCIYSHDGLNNQRTFDTSESRFGGLVFNFLRHIFFNIPCFTFILKLHLPNQSQLEHACTITTTTETITNYTSQQKWKSINEVIFFPLKKRIVPRTDFFLFWSVFSPRIEKAL